MSEHESRQPIEPLDPAEEASAEALARVLADPTLAGSGARERAAACEVAALRRVLGDGPTTAGWSARREARLVRRVLERTTREDLSWRGELRLVAGSVRERVAASPLLRFLAASLLLHLLGGPLVAWWLHRAEAPPDFVLTFDPTPRGPGATGEGAAAEERADVAGHGLGAPALDPDGSARPPADRVENALRRARFALARTRLVVAPGPPGAEEGPEMALLAARSRWLEARAWSEILDERASLERAGTVGLALLADACLDRFAQEGRRPELLNAVLSRLAASAEAAEGGPALRARRAALLERARAYGLWPAPAGFDPEAALDPLSAADLATLHALLAEAGLDPTRVAAAPR